MIGKLFVYGTLGPGRPNAHILEEIGGHWENGCVRGKLHQQGWGSAMGYPGIELDEQGKEVQGFVFTSDNLVNHWDELDAFEGEGYQRVTTEAKLEDGDTIPVNIYILAAS